MKNKRIYVSMLVMTISFLLAMYIFKIFFPEQFIIIINNNTIIKIGNYIDNNLWLKYILEGITAFITYFLYLCASSKRLYLNWKECLYILGTIIIVRVVSLFDTTFSTAISISSFLFLSALCKGKIKETAITYTIHTVAQALSLFIRSLPIYLIEVNFITTFIIGFECYLWLILCYIIFNIKKGE